MAGSVRIGHIVVNSHIAETFNSSVLQGRVSGVKAVSLAELLQYLKVSRAPNDEDTVAFSQLRAVSLSYYSLNAPDNIINVGCGNCDVSGISAD